MARMAAAECLQVKIGVLALQATSPNTGAAQLIVGIDSQPVRRPPDLVGLDGLILPGGESTTMSMLLDSSGLLEPLGKTSPPACPSSAPAPG